MFMLLSSFVTYSHYYLLSTWFLRSFARQWAARYRHVRSAAASTSHQLIPRSCKSSLNVADWLTD